MPEWVDRSVVQATKFKDLLPFTAVSITLLYGIGWVLRYLTITTYGVGALMVAHEGAIATGTAFGIAVTPCFALSITLDLLRKRFSERNRAARVGRMLLISALFACFSPLLFIAGILSRADLKLVTMCAFVLLIETIFTAITYFICLILHFEKPIWVSASLIVVIPIATTFGKLVMPVLPEPLGGLGQSEVRINLKEPNQVITGRWVASDSEALILTNAAREGDPALKGALRIPVSRMVDVVPLGAKR